MLILIIFCVGTVFSSAHISFISHNNVAELRAKNPTWESHDPESNPLRGKSQEELLSMITSPPFSKDLPDFHE